MPNVVDIFIQPDKALAELRERPTALVPITLVCLLATVSTAVYFLKVDPAWFIEHTLAASGRELSSAQLEEARKAMPGTGVIGYISTAFAVFASAGFPILFAIYLHMASRLAGRSTSFMQSLGLAAWASMPQALGSLSSLIAILAMEPQTALESVAVTNVDPLLVSLADEDRWSTLARSFSLLNLWGIALVAMGWRALGRAGWSQALLVAAMPALLVYGAMAGYALTK